jgi:hypothetical protein
MRRLLRIALVAGIALLAGCRDSPKEVVEEASSAAARGDLVTVRELFSVTTAQRLERAWRLSNTPESQGWDALSAKLHFNGEPLVVEEEGKIYGDYARVDAKAGVAVRDYYLRKEDGRWRIELGAGMRYRAAKAKADEAATAAAKSKANEEG